MIERRDWLRWRGFRPNEVRLWLSAIAYNLGDLWRRLVLPKKIDNWSQTSLRQRLLKTGGRVEGDGKVCEGLPEPEPFLGTGLMGTMGTLSFVNEYGGTALADVELAKPGSQNGNSG